MRGFEIFDLALFEVEMDAMREFEATRDGEGRKREALLTHTTEGEDSLEIEGTRIDAPPTCSKIKRTKIQIVG